MSRDRRSLSPTRLSVYEIQRAAALCQHLKLLLSTIQTEIDVDFLDWLSRILIAAGHNESVVQTFKKFSYKPEGGQDTFEYLVLWLNLESTKATK